jgi:glycine dehydrogenase subunit 2
MHEFVASARDLKRRTGIRTLDVAKGLIDRGFHPPTVYFPLIVEEALLIEPTETEAVETLDDFAAALDDIAVQATKDPEALRNAPIRAPVRRVDEAGAARRPDLRWRAMSGAEMPCPD